MFSEEHEVLVEMGYHDLIERFPHEMVEVSVQPFEFGTFIVDEKTVIFSGEHLGHRHSVALRLSGWIKGKANDCMCSHCRTNKRDRYRGASKTWKNYRDTQFNQ